MDPRGHWYRSYEEMGDDPKFRVIAKRAATVVPGVRASDALAVWTQLLCRASSCPDRGSIEGYDCETADLSLDMPEGAACALLQAFEDKGMTLNGRILKWEERQPKREDGSAERAKKWREEQKQTRANTTERNRTLDQNRSEKNREEDSLSSSVVLSPAQTPVAPVAEDFESEFQSFPELDSMPFEFQDLVKGYPQARVDLVPSFKIYRRMCKAPGFCIQSVLSDVVSRGKSSKWTKGYAPNLSKYLGEMRWRDPPEDDGAPPGGDAIAQFLAMTGGAATDSKQAGRT